MTTNGSAGEGRHVPPRTPRAPRSRRQIEAAEDAAATARSAAARLELVKPGPAAGGDDDDATLPGPETPRAVTRRAGPDPTTHGRRIPVEGRTIETPAKLSVRLYCPSCDEPLIVEARLQARLTRDNDGAGAVALRTKAAKVSHVCGQPSLGLAEGPRDR